MRIDSGEQYCSQAHSTARHQFVEAAMTCADHPMTPRLRDEHHLAVNLTV
jgi:hypothetical protein